MWLIDFILNLAGLLLWFNRRAARSGSAVKPGPANLSGGHKDTETTHWVQRLFPSALLVLIGGRAFFYRLLGPAVDWTASLDLGAITLFFRTDHFWLMAIFSGLSFVRALVMVYFWLLALCIINRSAAAPDTILRLIRRQLGYVAAWPTYVQLALPLLFVAVAWPGFHALLAYAKVTNPLPSFGPLMLQAAVIGVGIFFSLKYLIPALLLADLIARYIYFGSGPFWEFLTRTARNLLAPLQRLPLRAGKMDFAPVVGIVLTLLLLDALPRLVMHELQKRNLTLWPQ
jgi:uncharacterized protein YggT (Ycf19 family)